MQTISIQIGSLALHSNMRCIVVGRIRRFRDGFKRLTPRREYIYAWETGYPDEGFYGKGNFDSVDDYKRRKWSRIHKVKHRNKKTVNKEIKQEIK